MIGELRNALRQPRWKLTLSYTAVAVGTLLIMLLILAMLVFSTVLIPGNVLAPECWITTTSEQVVPIFRGLLAASPTDLVQMGAILEGVDQLGTTITSGEFIQIGQIQVNVRATADIDLIVVGPEGSLLATSSRDLVPLAAYEKPFDAAEVPGLAGPLQAALTVGESMTCTASGTAREGWYANLGMATGTPTNGLEDAYAEEPSHYFGAAPAITIEKRTNSQDADSAPGPYVVVGDPVIWTYIVTNTGNITLTGVTVVDDQGVLVDCPATTLVAEESMTCTASGTAAGGQYANLGTVTGTPPGDLPDVSAQDPSHYYGSEPGLVLEKRTNAVDAGTPRDLYLLVGDPVTWTYVVTNTGNVTLTGVTVCDDQGVAVNCPGDELGLGEWMACEATGLVVAGPYTNTGVVTGTPPVGSDEQAGDVSYHFGATPTLSIEKQTNGQDAGTAPGPYILAGDAVTWTYVVTNTGNVTLTGVTVTDDQPGVTPECLETKLGVSESMTCEATGVAAVGQYTNTGIVSGTPPGGLADVLASEVSHYFGATPDIAVEKRTNGVEAGTVPGPYILAGDPVTWTYVVTNTGNVTLTGVTMSDDQPGVTPECAQSTLGVSETMECEATGVAAIGQYTNTGTVEGTPPVGDVVTASDVSHYFGATPAVKVEKGTNGQDADGTPGPYILVGDAVTWTYVVTNTGNVTLTGVTVTDDQLGILPCSGRTLPVSEAMTCEVNGTASAGQYANAVIVIGTPPVGLADVSDVDASHYFGSDPTIAIEKSTNGLDADLPGGGPVLIVGMPVTWSYHVTNTGNVPLENVVLTDDREVGIFCPQTGLAISESMTCTATGEAESGHYRNQGAVSASHDGTTVSDSDVSHYYGRGSVFSVYLPLILRRGLSGAEGILSSRFSLSPVAAGTSGAVSHAALGVASYQRCLCSAGWDVPGRAHIGLPLPTDVRTGLDELCCAGRGPGQSVAGPGCVAADRRLVPAPLHQAPPARPGAGVLSQARESTVRLPESIGRWALAVAARDNEIC